MREWTLVKDSHLPDVGQKVFYHYIGGTYSGLYYGISKDEDMVDLHCFGGDSGFLLDGT